MPHLPLQDALLFLKEFFTSLAAGINPMVPAETSTEGERLGQGGEGLNLCLPATLASSPICPHSQLTLRPESIQAAPRKGSLRA